MKSKKPASGENFFTGKENSGFTLIELIIIIMLFGFLGAIIAPLIGPALTGSHRPIENLDHATDLSAEMAEVVAEYRIDGQDNISIDANNTKWVKFVPDEDEDNEYNETGCDTGSNDCVLRVRINSSANPGETLTHYFP
ncbi:MAG: prepilin-type N-terminal cleavage/methylation domain-containing protein [Desulfosalsimonas sp.]